jgi:hypothetical protein
VVVSTEVGTLGRPEDARHEGIAKLARVATLSGMVAEDRRLRLHAHAWVDRSNQPLYDMVLGLVAGLQICEARLMADALADSGVCQPSVTPHPENGLREEPDEIASVVETLIAPMGRQPTPWPDRLFEDLQRNYLGRPPCLLANADAAGLTAEFPWGTESSLLQARTDQAHPLVGNGLLVLSSFRQEDIPDQARLDPLLLNAWEMEHAQQQFFGSWRAPSDGLVSFATFLPNVMNQPAAAATLILLGVGRARLMSTHWLGDDWSKTWDSKGKCRARTAMERAAAERPQS